MRADFADTYHRVESEHWWFLGRRHGVAMLVRGSGAGPDARILDIGCSAGATMRALRDAGYRHVSGIDFSADAIERCRQSGLTEVAVMDAQAPTFPPESFDVIVASDILEHLPDDERALGAWFNLLRAGGTLITFVPAYRSLWSAHDEANQHQRRYRLGDLKARLERAGFQPERGAYWNVLLLFPAAALRLAQRWWRGLGEAEIELRIPPAPINRGLASLLYLENRLLEAGIDWPLGLSVVAVARKPASARLSGPASPVRVAA